MNTGTGYLTGQAKPRNVVSVGDTGALRRIVNVADGSADQDAVTVAQLKRSIDDTVARVTNAGAGGAVNTGIFYDTVTTGPADNSITLRNTSGKGTIVRNMAPGVLDTDATNVKQVKELVDTSKTHYYSVKSSNNNNFNNDLASGVDSMAAGVSIKALGERSVAIGSDAKSNSKSASALGDTAQALANDALAIGTQAQASGSASAAIGARSAVSGGNTYVVGSDNSNNPAGTGATIAATNSGVFGNQNRLEGNKNRLVGNSNTVKLESMALFTTPKKIEDVMITGNDNTVSGDPDASTQGDAGNILGISVTGSKNTIQAKNSGNKDLKNIGIVGNNNTIDTSNTARNLSDTQILGSDVTATLGNSVYLGSKSAYVVAGASTKGMDAYTGNGTYNYAGGTPAGVVTVGSVGKERRIQNVAAGLVSTTSTDAINGSQLYNHTLPLRFGSDNSTIGATAAADNNVIHRGSNQAMSILGGANGNNLTDNNIGVVTEATNNKMTVKLAKDLNGLNTVNANTVKTGDTTMTTNGVTINNGPKIVKTGIDAGGKKITNVANGTDNSDAVNFGQLKSQSDALTAKGFGIKAEDGNKVHKALGEDVDVIGDGKNISTKVDGTSVRVAMKDDITVTSVTAQDGNSNKTVTNANGVTTEDNTGNKTVVNKDGITINKADPTGNKTVSLTGDGLNNGGNKITNVADGVDDKDAVNKSQLDNATAAATTTVTAGNNIIVTKTTNQNGSTNYEVALKDQVTLGSDPTKQIALDGTTGMIKAGDKVTIDGKDGKIDAGKIAVDGKDGYVTGLENKTFDLANIVSGRAATEDQLKASHDSLNQKITNMGDEITKKGMDFAGNTGEFHRDLGQKVTIKGEGTEADDKYSGENIKTVADQAGNITIKMAKNIKTDSVTTDKVKVGKDGQDGVSITGPNGADGTDGKVGISGKDGKDAVSMSGKNGIGHIGLNGKDGRSADITVEKGDPNLDDKEITRIKYKDEDGTTHQVTTKDDGMKYGGTAVTLSRRSLTLKSMLRVAFPMKVN